MFSSVCCSPQSSPYSGRLASPETLPDNLVQWTTHYVVWPTRTTRSLNPSQHWSSQQATSLLSLWEGRLQEDRTDFCRNAVLSPVMGASTGTMHPSKPWRGISHFSEAKCDIRTLLWNILGSLCDVTSRLPLFFFLSFNTELPPSLAQTESQSDAIK